MTTAERGVQQRAVDALERLGEVGGDAAGPVTCTDTRPGGRPRPA